MKKKEEDTFSLGTALPRGCGKGLGFGSPVVSSQDQEGPREDRLLPTRKHLPRPLNA